MREPRAVGLSALAALVLLACAGSARTSTEPGGPAAAQPVAFTTLAQASVPGGSGGAAEDVVRDAAGYQALWGRLGTSQTAPAVDFTKKMVISVALATQSCTAKVTIQTITRDANGLAVNVLEQYPGPQCRCMVASRPFHVVALDRQSGDVAFHSTRGPDTC